MFRVQPADMPAVQGDSVEGDRDRLWLRVPGKGHGRLRSRIRVLPLQALRPLRHARGEHRTGQRGRHRGGKIKYILKVLRRGFKDIPANHMRLTIRAHGEREAYRKAVKEAESWHSDLIPNDSGDIIWERIEVKPRKPKPKNKHPAKPPELDEHELNELVRRIEVAYRNTEKGWNYSRLGSISAYDVRNTIWKHRIGFICRYCLVNFRGRYCCTAHSDYYRVIVMEFYGRQYPWAEIATGDSIDHIVPISMGGLEFDRDNLQWMDLKDNIRKGGRNVVRNRRRSEMKSAIAAAFMNALALENIIDPRPLRDVPKGQSRL